MSRKPNTQCSICSKPHYKRPSLLEKDKGRSYCSQACYGKSCQKPRKCIICGKEYLASKNSQTCSRSCSNKNRAGIGYKGGVRSTLDKPECTKAWRRKLVDELSACEECGFANEIALDVHHLTPRSKGGKNIRENLKLLCANCHRLAHHYMEE